MSSPIYRLKHGFCSFVLIKSKNLRFWTIQEPPSPQSMLYFQPTQTSYLEVRWNKSSETKRGEHFIAGEQKRDVTHRTNTQREGQTMDKSLGFLNFERINNFTQKRILKEKPIRCERFDECVSAWGERGLMRVDSTCHSLGRSRPQPPALSGTRWAGRGGCSGGSSCFAGPRWMPWSLSPPGTGTHRDRHAAWVRVGQTDKGAQVLINLFHFWGNVPWTESGSPPWCNPGRSTFWWSVRRDHFN